VKDNLQLHHIDGDSSNTAWENLAPICLNCHSEAHTDRKLARGLSPELIRLYNEEWREIVAQKRQPNAEQVVEKELAAEAFHEVSMVCHAWKVAWMRLAGSVLPDGGPGSYKDVWDLMADRWIPDPSEDTYRKHAVLFTTHLLEVERRFDRALTLFSDALPAEFRITLMRAHRQLALERQTYFAYPVLIKAGVVPSENEGLFFRARFTGVIDVLRRVCRDADSRRETLFKKPKKVLRRKAK